MNHQNLYNVIFVNINSAKIIFKFYNRITRIAPYVLKVLSLQKFKILNNKFKYSIAINLI